MGLRVTSEMRPPLRQIELYELPWSPYCLVIRRLLEYSGVAHRRIRVGMTTRTVVWKLTRERYYQVPVIRDGESVLFETDATSQVLAKYLDAKLQLNLFPAGLEGVQSLLWRYVEDDLEGVAFKLNDIHWRTFVPPREQLDFLRFKERKFGRGCLDRWAAEQDQLQAELASRLQPFEAMLCDKDFLLDFRPHFLDFDLWGVMANYMWTGKNRLPAMHNRLGGWYARMCRLTLNT